MNIKELVKEAKKVAWIEVKEEVVEETKANEVMNSWAQYFWQELVPTNVQADPLLDLLGNFSKLLPLLPWNHGNNMAISEKVPVIGEADLFSANTEWTTGAWTLTPANQGPDTDKVVISQWQYILTVDVSDRELNYAPERLETIIRERINASASRTIDAVLINGDDASSNNINGTYDATAYYTQGEWLRKVGIANTAVSIGTITSASYLSVKGVIDPRYQAELNDLLFIEPGNVYDKSMLLSEVITIDKFGPNATVSSGVLAKIFNIDILVARDFPALTTTTWVVDGTTTANNSKGSFLCVYKPAVQYWFGKPLQIEVGRVLGKGIKIVATMEFWFAIVNSKAWLGKTVWMWVNATVS